MWFHLFIIHFCQFILPFMYLQNLPLASFFPMAIQITLSYNYAFIGFFVAWIKIPRNAAAIYNSYRISNLRRKSQALFCTEEICLETALINVAGTAVIQKFFFSLTRYMDAAQRTIIASVWFVQLK